MAYTKPGLAMFIRTEFKDPTRTMARAWPSAFPEIERQLREILKEDASEDDIRAEIIGIADDEKLFRPIVYREGRDIDKMTTLERHELANRLALAQREKKTDREGDE